LLIEGRPFSVVIALKIVTFFNVVMKQALNISLSIGVNNKGIANQTLERDGAIHCGSEIKSLKIHLGGFLDLAS